MLLANHERIDRTITTAGNTFSVRNVVLLGRKGRDNVKLSPFYNREYNSQKYSTHSKLEQLQINTSDYIVFAYNAFIENKNINEEVFISYPHIQDLRDFLAEALNQLNIQNLYTNNGVAPEYADLVVRSQPFAGGKTLAIIPHKIQREHNNNSSFVDGCILFVNDDDKWVEIDLLNLYTMYTILENFDLYSNSNMLLTQAMLFDLGRGGVAPASTGGGTGSQPSTPRKVNSIFNNKNSEGSGPSKPGMRRPSIPKRSVNPTTETAEETQQEKPAKRSINRKPVKTNVEELSEEVNAEQGSGNSPLALGNILKGAEEVELPPVDPGEGEDISF